MNQPPASGSDGPMGERRDLAAGASSPGGAPGPDAPMPPERTHWANGDGVRRPGGPEGSPPPGSPDRGPQREGPPGGGYPPPGAVQVPPGAWAEERPPAAPRRPAHWVGQLLIVAVLAAALTAGAFVALQRGFPTASTTPAADNPTACSLRKMVRSPTRSRIVSAVPMNTAAIFATMSNWFGSLGEWPTVATPNPVSPGTISDIAPKMNGSSNKKLV